MRKIYFVLVFFLGIFVSFIWLATGINIQSTRADTAFCAQFPELARGSTGLTVTNETTGQSVSVSADHRETQFGTLAATIGDRLRIEASAGGLPQPDNDDGMIVHSSVGVFQETNSDTVDFPNNAVVLNIVVAALYNDIEVSFNPCGSGWSISRVQLIASSPSPSPTPTPTPSPEITLSKTQSRLTYPETGDIVTVLNKGDDGSLMQWGHDLNADLAFVNNKIFSFINSALAADHSSEGRFITFVNDGLDGDLGAPLAGSDSRSGSFTLRAASQVTKVGTVYSGAIIERCSNCRSGQDRETLNVDYTIPSPTVDLKVKIGSGGSYEDGPITIDSGQQIYLQWTSTNANATIALQPSPTPTSGTAPGANFSGPTQANIASGTAGPITVTQSGNYILTVRGLSDVDIDSGNFATDPITVIVNTPTPTPNATPTVSSVGATPGDYCIGLSVAVNWTYSDPENDPQSAYQIQVDDQGSNFGAPLHDTLKQSGGGGVVNVSLPGALLNKTLKSRVKVWDSNDNQSSWSASSNTWKTPKNAYPQANFSWTPTNPKTGTLVQFNDLSTFYDNGGDSVHSWAWLFGDGNSSSSKNPSHTYASKSCNGTNTCTVNLTVTDKNGYSCPAPSQTLNLSRGVPGWKEVLP